MNGYSLLQSPMGLNTHHNLRKANREGAKNKWALAKFRGGGVHSGASFRWPKRKGKKSVGGQHLSKKGGYWLASRQSLGQVSPRPGNYHRARFRKGPQRRAPQGQTYGFVANMEPKKSRGDSLWRTTKGKGKVGDNARRKALAVGPASTISCGAHWFLRP